VPELGRWLVSPLRPPILHRVHRAAAWTTVSRAEGPITLIEASAGLEVQPNAILCNAFLFRRGLGQRFVIHTLFGI